jgi:hypothetical protein
MLFLYRGNGKEFVWMIFMAHDIVRITGRRCEKTFQKTEKGGYSL